MLFEVQYWKAVGCKLSFLSIQWKKKKPLIMVVNNQKNITVLVYLSHGNVYESEFYNYLYNQTLL